jgi:hypothetical protein
MIINKKTGKVEVEHALPAENLTDPKTVHPQFRRIRITAKGTYLLPFLKMNKVVEYDKHFNPIWTYETSTPWAAARLHNGNTLITDEHDELVREVNPRYETVWEFKQSDLPADVVLRNLQTAERLANGNTVIFSSTGGSKREDRPNWYGCCRIGRISALPPQRSFWTNPASRKSQEICSDRPECRKSSDLPHQSFVASYWWCDQNVRSISLTCTNCIVYGLTHGEETRNA